MLVSYKWLMNYIDGEIPLDEVVEILTNTGLEVEGVENNNKFENIHEGVVIGFVKSIEKHPEADKLTICQVDVGGENDLQIICGAPNVDAGQKVAVATIGSQLDFTDGKSLKIKSAKLKGTLSEGMICAEDELGLGQNHEGIMVLDVNLPIGIPFKEAFGGEGDQIIEIAITPNRGDAISFIGIARDIAAVTGKKMLVPSTDSFSIGSNKIKVDVEIAIPDLCPRYSCVVVDGLKVKESPDWLKSKLKSIGHKPVNNIVDACNYLMYENGQPLHAFDLDKIASNKIIVNNLAKDYKFKALDGSEIELFGNEIMICDTEKGVAMGGIMGGFNSMVTESTTTILIESAYFNPTSIRKSSKKHLLLTDAAYRFERGTDPNFTVEALKRAALLIQEVAGGEISSEIVDVYPNPISLKEIELNFDYVRKICGNYFTNEQIVNVLESLEYHIPNITENTCHVIVPSYRPDVERPIDLVEEFLRIYSYNKITFDNKVNSSLPNEEKSLKIKLLNGISSYLTSNSFYEILTPSFTNSKYLNQTESNILPVKTLNAVNSNLDTLRTEFTLAGLETIAFNHNRNNFNTKIFEFGKTYFRVNDRYVENEKLGIWISGFQNEENWYQPSKKVDFYYLKSIIFNVLKLGGFDHSNLKQIKIEEDNFSYGVELRLKKTKIAKIGLLSNDLMKKFDIKSEVFYAEIDLEKVMNQLSLVNVKYTSPSKFPGSSRDLAFVVDKNVTFEEVKQKIKNLNFNILKDISIFDKYEGEKISPDKKSYAIRLKFQDENKTLEDIYLDKMMEKIISLLENEFNAIIRK